MTPPDLPRAPAGTVAPAAPPERGALATLATMGPCYWSASLVAGAVAFVAVGVPTALVNTPIFGRTVAPRWFDYVVLAVSSALIGLTWAARGPGAGAPDVEADPDEQRSRRRTVAGGALTYLAVGCPVCNKLVLVALGTSGALTWFAPLQPVLGVAAVALLAITLRRRLRRVGTVACAA